MNVRIIEQPSGLLNGVAWPAAGETIDLPDEVAEGMIGAGQVERVKEQAKPAKKAAAKPPSAEEKRPASTAKVEKRAAKKV